MTSPIPVATPSPPAVAPGRHRRLGLTAVLAAVAVLTAACSCSVSNEEGGPVDGFGDPGDCTVVDMAVSSEKIDLLTSLAKSFNGSDAGFLRGGVGLPPGGSRRLVDVAGSRYWWVDLSCC